MCPSPDIDQSTEAASSRVEAAASRFSPADKFDSPDRTGSARRVADFRAQQRRSQQLNEYCDEAVAAIRASLERPSDGSGSAR
jgi:hypothetical protein